MLVVLQKKINYNLKRLRGSLKKPRNARNFRQSINTEQISEVPVCGLTYVFESAPCTRGIKSEKGNWIPHLFGLKPLSPTTCLFVTGTVNFFRLTVTTQWRLWSEPVEDFYNVMLKVKKTLLSATNVIIVSQTISSWRGFTMYILLLSHRS